jgi:hypothetical protein
MKLINVKFSIFPPSGEKGAENIENLSNNSEK